uniref:Putative mitochondrial/ ribosomal protein l18 n=1 Tax=Phlebotomus kandelakii TaxID=1109342 RepID=A0A6B2EB50_9DIPT
MRQILRINTRFLSDFVRNRNPVNAEMIGVAIKPNGYYLEKKKELFHNTLHIDHTNTTVSARIVNPEKQITVLRVSTQDWSLKKHLYKLNDTAAFVLLAQVLAQRCLHAGITQLAPSASIKFGPDFPKHNIFLQTLTDNEVSMIKS